jgi:hypothetical protein
VPAGLGRPRYPEIHATPASLWFVSADLVTSLARDARVGGAAASLGMRCELCGLCAIVVTSC